MLDLSNAFLLVQDQRDRESQLFNFVMAAVFSAGVAAFLAHTFILVGRGRRWLAIKLLALVAYWGSILSYMG